MTVSTLKRLFTIEEYYQMGRSGIFTEDDRVELIEGEIVQMTPIRSPHAGCLKWLNDYFKEHLGKKITLGIQDPLRLSEYSEPEPDILLLKRRPHHYRHAHPVPDDVFLLIEVADSSLDYDKNVKIPLYAKHHIVECWLVNLQDKNIEVYRQPSENGYQQILALAPDQTLSPQAFPDILVKVGDILGI